MTPYPWIETLPGAAAVDTAARLGLFDNPDANRPPVLVGCLEGLGVLDPAGTPTPAFAVAWRHGQADMLARARFYLRAARDIAGGLDALVSDLPAFMARSETFRLFRYDTARTTDPEALAATAEWVGYLEALARVESPVLAPLLPYAPCDRVLEVGGNTGLMASALADRGVTATVLDLPAVCALGRARRPGIVFVAGDGRDGAAYAGFRGQVEHVLFKSVLHDWPDADMIAMLSHAAAIVPPGGTVTVCERAAPRPADLAAGSMQAVANLVFAPFYRGGSVYEKHLADKGFSVERREALLEMPFDIVTGRRL